MRRLLVAALVTMLGSSFVAFGFMHLAPIDPARFMVGFNRPGMREDQVNRVREWYGLDDPIPVQYLRWMSRVVRGDFGASMNTRRDVAPETVRRLPWSLLLAGVAGILSWGMALPLAVASARGGVLGRIAGALISIGEVVPGFLVATSLVYVFAVRLTLIPILPPFELNPLDGALWVGLILPAASLSLPMAAWLAGRMRPRISERLGARYVLGARAMGISERRAVWRHPVRIVTTVLLSRPLEAISLLLSGLVLVEEIYNWPGVGRSFTRALSQRDVPVMQGVLLILAVTAVAAEVLVRLAIGRSGIEPRAHLAAADSATFDARPAAVVSPALHTKVAAALALGLVVAAVAAPLVTRFPPDQVLLDEINMGPSWRHWMGTDSSGRDLFSRLLYAGRATLGISVAGAVIAVLAGALLTARRGTGPLWTDAVSWMGRVVLALPSLGLALAIVATAGRAPWVIAALFAALGLPSLIGRLRALQSRAWRWPFVQAAQAAGASTWHMGERHLLPHLARPLAAAAAGLVPGFIVLEATLGFLGFSVSPTTPSWGTLLWRSREVMHRGDWWLIVFPTLFMAVSAWAFGALAVALAHPAPPTYAAGSRLKLGREWGSVGARTAGHVVVAPAAGRHLPQVAGGSGRTPPPRRDPSRRASG